MFSIPVYVVITKYDGFVFDFIFAVVIALVIYGCGLVIQLFEDRKVL